METEILSVIIGSLALIVACIALKFSFKSSQKSTGGNLFEPEYVPSVDFDEVHRTPSPYQMTVTNTSHEAKLCV